MVKGNSIKEDNFSVHRALVKKESMLFKLLHIIFILSLLIQFLNTEILN